MPGLDPGICLQLVRDCRVKPGNDVVGLDHPRDLQMPGFHQVGQDLQRSAEVGMRTGGADVEADGVGHRLAAHREGVG